MAENHPKNPEIQVDDLGDSKYRKKYVAKDLETALEMDKSKIRAKTLSQSPKARVNTNLRGHKNDLRHSQSKRIEDSDELCSWI